MAFVLLLLLLLAFARVSDATWCVCRSDVSDTALQAALDYACGSGADCTPILQTGACYNPNTVQSHCSYAVNNYFQLKGQASGSCGFSGAATITNTDPSSGSCTYPSSASTSGNGTITPSTPTTPTFSTPTALTPPSGILGLGPSGSTSGFINGSARDYVPRVGLVVSLMAMVLSGLMFRI